MKRLHNIWRHMIERCYDPSCEKYKNYGKRGITVYEPWRTSYEAFKGWALTNGYKPGEKLTLDRKDNDLGYYPYNLRFVTNLQNQMNRRGNANSVSRYKGVYYAPGRNKPWRARLELHGKRYSGGYFATETEAADAYNRLAIEKFGKFAYLNKV